MSLRHLAKTSRTYLQEAGGDSRQDIYFSLANLAKAGGLWKSSKQAQYLMKEVQRFKLGPQTIYGFVKDWAEPYTREDPEAVVAVLDWDLGYGKRDLAKMRMLGYAVVVDSQGVKALARLDFDHKLLAATGSIRATNIRDVTFVRSIEGPALYGKQSLSKENQELVMQITKLSNYDRLDILQSFVDQLNKGRDLSPKQMQVLSKYIPALGDTLVTPKAAAQVADKLGTKAQEVYDAFIKPQIEYGNALMIQSAKMIQKALTDFIADPEDVSDEKMDKLSRRFAGFVPTKKVGGVELNFASTYKHLRAYAAGHSQDTQEYAKNWKELLDYGRALNNISFSEIQRAGEKENDDLRAKRGVAKPSPNTGPSALDVF